MRADSRHDAAGPVDNEAAGIVDDGVRAVSTDGRRSVDLVLATVVDRHCTRREGIAKTGVVALRDRAAAQHPQHRTAEDGVAAKGGGRHDGIAAHPDRSWTDHAAVEHGCARESQVVAVEIQDGQVAARIGQNEMVRVGEIGVEVCRRWRAVA